MKLQAIVSSIALAATLSFSGAAVAQNMLNGVAIPADQIQSFKDKCEALRAANTASLATDDNGDEVDAVQTGSVGADDNSASDEADPAAKDNWAEALASMTVEECDAAGFPAQ